MCGIVEYQRQQLGIARVLYKQSSESILDEVTLTFDNNAKEVVMKTVEGLSRNLSLIMTSHRLTMVQRFDRVIHLGGGLGYCRWSLSDVLQDS